MNKKIGYGLASVLIIALAATNASAHNKKSCNCDYNYKQSKKYNQDYTRDDGRSYGQGKVIEHHGPVGHVYHEHYGEAEYGDYNPPSPNYNNLGNYDYSNGWYVPSPYSYYGQQAGFANVNSYSQPVVQSYSYSYGPEYVPAPPYTPPPIPQQIPQQISQSGYNYQSTPTCGIMVCQ